ncbi:uncharacterized protein LOC132696123 [Cylas formicarius]|uniref:uncharacterized protein LOC132696123 n=1 Tax=Cylas formicarius TaxID=197179 RepID=UPI002958B923|nr:uncharacterized protein LOC132696123 [Cylas formicarius]
MEASNSAHNKLVSFFQEGKFVDCTFKIKGEEVKAHKLILACASPVFEKMFFGSMPSNEIFLDDVELDVFNQMLDYIYTYKTKITSVTNGWSLFYVAEKYFIKELMQLCLSYIMSNLTMSTLALSFEYSQFYNIHDLKQHCFDSLVDSLNAVICGEYHIKPSTLRAALKQNQLISKEALASFIIVWAIDECRLKNKNLSPESVVQILKDEDIVKYIYKDGVLPLCEYCSVALTKCQCVDEVISKIFILLSKEEVCQEEPLKFLTFDPMPLLCQTKPIFKIARRIDFSEGEEFVSSVSADSTFSVFGLVLCTEMKREQTECETYIGTIAVRFCELNSDDIVKPTVVRSEFFYNSEVYVPLKFPVTLVPEKMYDIRISYRNLDSKFVSSVICSYMGSELSNKFRNSSRLYFYDICGTIIKGVAFYPD